MLIEKDALLLKVSVAALVFALLYGLPNIAGSQVLQGQITNADYDPQGFLDEVKQCFPCGEYGFLCDQALHVHREKRKHWWFNETRYMLSQEKNIKQIEKLSVRYNIGIL